MIGLGTSITDVAEFNRRAAIALRGVTFGQGNGERVVAEFQRQQAAGQVSEKMQQAIFNIIHRFRRQISDQMVTTYAALRAEGADS
jgi:hypothetical protein